MSLAPVILLPPSEGKKAGGRGRPWTPGRGTFPELDERREQVAAALIRAMTVVRSRPPQAARREG